ncbi:hypothetical protein [Flavobacterium sp.]|uniref:hypothetical protein n=1 Tax=Flavobacterium sp. TaxID=239 RepID=UPI00374CF1FC
MNPVFKNTLAVIIGLFVGSVANMSIILMSSSVIPAPHGADVTTIEGLKATMHLFEPKHFIFPFVAHALGTFAGAAVTALIAANNKMRLALAIGAFFLLGGIVNVCTLPSPIWYNVIDLLFAYLPMAYLGKKLVTSEE